MRAPPIAALGFLAGVTLACSTPEVFGVEQECFTDDDCDPGEVCLLEQGGVCQNLSSSPRRRVLGLDITEDDFRVEFLGCDGEIDPIDGVLRTDRRESLSSTNLIKPVNETYSQDCSECPEDCIGGNACRSPYEGTIRLSEASRLGLLALRSPLESFPLLDEEEMPLEDPVPFEWSRYVLTNDNLDAPVVVELVPTDASLAPIRRELAPPSTNDTRDIEIVTRLDCQRRVSGDIRRMGTSTALSEASVDLYFNEPVATPSLTLGVPEAELPACTDSSDCAAGHACATDIGRCVLSLEGTKANRAAQSLEGSITVPVYTYCEDEIITERDFRVELIPASGSGLPTMHYEVTQDFSLAFVGQIVNDPLPADLCVPDWASPLPLSLSYSGEPVKILETNSGSYVCCTADCLPSVDEDKEPTDSGECSEIPLTTMTMGTKVPDVDETTWTEDDCLLPVAGDAGSYTVAGSCEAGTCSVEVSPGQTGPTASGLSYTLTLVSPPNSVFASRKMTVNVGADTTELPTVALSPRVVVEGRVSCDESLGDGCKLGDVAIVAERLRRSDESEPPPPFRFNARTRADGRYTLLLDPGVYVMTAIPDSGNAAGPSTYRVLDARLGEDNAVNVDAGVPRVDWTTNPFVLTEGVPVVLRLRDFEAGGTVQPIDLGSWTSQANPPVGEDGEVLDLNDPQTCYSDLGGDRGCFIRDMLQPGNAGVLASISNAVDFTMRRAGEVSCPAP